MLEMEWEEVKLIKPHPSLLKILHNNKKIAASFINNLKEKMIIHNIIFIIIINNKDCVGEYSVPFFKRTCHL